MHGGAYPRNAQRGAHGGQPRPHPAGRAGDTGATELECLAGPPAHPCRAHRPGLALGVQR